MSYRKMVDSAKSAGVTNEAMMWESIDSFSELLEELKESHPQRYWEFMRKQHGIMFHNHYDECFAMYDVSQIHYTSKTGEKKHGAYWTVEQIETATAGLKFPAGTTKWDKYVAVSVIYSDLCKVVDDNQIIKIAYEFFFNDEDWGTDTKVWEYIAHKPH